MSQIHIHAAPGEVAPLVLLPGDPKRASFIAENFFTDPELYTDHRGMLGYTGTYRGMPVSVQTTGMGCPSLAITVEELVRLGARTLVRVGTAGIISRDVKPGELIVATGAVPNDGTTRQYLDGAPYAPVPDFSVTAALHAKAVETEQAVHTGLIQTEDAFYATTPDHVEALAEQGVLAIEMEASALFLLGKLRGVKTGCALVASNYIGDPQLVAAEVLQDGIAHMTRTVLEAGRDLQQ
ncbi:MAG TPA: purine-nucleoside phosphorylase [Deinococcales bacterium]|nr:purine-nucleoside phosphorylase [Deinococcales bacterium]